MGQVSRTFHRVENSNPKVWNVLYKETFEFQNPICVEINEESKPDKFSFLDAKNFYRESRGSNCWKASYKLLKEAIHVYPDGAAKLNRQNSQIHFSCLKNALNHASKEWSTSHLFVIFL